VWYTTASHGSAAAVVPLGVVTIWTTLSTCLDSLKHLPGFGGQPFKGAHQRMWQPRVIDTGGMAGARWGQWEGTACTELTPRAIPLPRWEHGIERHSDAD
jgi:hypothetical protein